MPCWWGSRWFSRSCSITNRAEQSPLLGLQHSLPLAVLYPTFPVSPLVF